MSIFIAVIIFGLVVLVHELGHFAAARRCGIWVEEFAIGMGPKLFGWQKGETLYTIRALPLGGFCRMHGDDAAPAEGGDDTQESIAGKALNSKPIYQRMMVMFAGSFMNFVLAFILFTIVVGFTGFRTTTIMHVAQDSPAQAAGIVPGDRITHINGSRRFLWEDVLFEVSTGYGRPVEIGFMRDGRRLDTTIAPVWTGDRYLLGIGPGIRTGMFTEPPEGFYRTGITEAATVGFMRIGFFIRTTVLGLIRLVTAGLGMDQLAGPIGIVNIIGGQYQEAVDTAAAVGASTAVVVLSVVITMTNFAAIISANLGVVNLLPLPALDGGRIVFLTLEAIRRKPVSPEREGMVHLAGFVLLMILAVFIAYQDILNLL